LTLDKETEAPATCQSVTGFSLTEFQVLEVSLSALMCLAPATTNQIPDSEFEFFYFSPTTLEH
jgi:hypothetical protein